MRILGIETSCDETAAAIVEDGTKILSSVVSSSQEIHKKYGGRDIDQWMIDLLKPAQGSKILDIGCGAGKQCFLYLDYTKGIADITGGDVSEELLTKAHSENEKRGNPVKFQE